ncbi:jg12034 [Pararge aegeria aegeria]|uniref:Jg12034 protein n=1 Tax=Pararge aegeria aegeria TaxID=348720 RepID=A0A8S4QBC1_9NEOP|nr:jg12034 [Pararge aegeria aegeria]
MNRKQEKKKAKMLSLKFAYNYKGNCALETGTLLCYLAAEITMVVVLTRTSSDSKNLLLLKGFIPSPSLTSRLQY